MDGEPTIANHDNSDNRRGVYDTKFGCERTNMTVHVTEGNGDRDQRRKTMYNLLRQ